VTVLAGANDVLAQYQLVVAGSVTQDAAVATLEQAGTALADQVNRIAEHLCEQLHVTIRLKDAQSEVFPPNVKDLGFDPTSVRTVLLIGLQVAGVMIHHAAPETSEEPPWS